MQVLFRGPLGGASNLAIKGNRSGNLCCRLQEYIKNSPQSPINLVEDVKKSGASEKAQHTS